MTREQASYVCVCVCVCVCVSLSLSLRVCVLDIRTDTCIHVGTDAHNHMCSDMCVHTFTCTQPHTHSHTHARMDPGHAVTATAACALRRPNRDRARHSGQQRPTHHCKHTHSTYFNPTTRRKQRQKAAKSTQTWSDMVEAGKGGRLVHTLRPFATFFSPLCLYAQRSAFSSDVFGSCSRRRRRRR